MASSCVNRRLLLLLLARFLPEGEDKVKGDACKTNKTIMTGSSCASLARSRRDLQSEKEEEVVTLQNVPNV